MADGVDVVVAVAADADVGIVNGNAVADGGDAVVAVVVDNDDDNHWLVLCRHVYT